MQYFNGTTATMSDQSIATIITKTGFVRNEVQSTDPSRSNTIPKRWYWNYPTLTPLTTLTGAYVT